MGAPWFEIAHLAESSGLVALYGDMSDRMMSLAAGLGPAQEIYSIDESFIDVGGVRGCLTHRGAKVRTRILDWIHPLVTRVFAKASMTWKAIGMAVQAEGNSGMTRTMNSSNSGTVNAMSP